MEIMDINGVVLLSVDAPTLIQANLRDANLRGANLYGANLCGADLYEANLRGANLCGAVLYEANLHGVKNFPPLIAAQLSIIPAGTIRGWKKLCNGSIAQLEIDDSTPRSNATGRKCRAQSARVLCIFDSHGQEVEEGRSIYAYTFIYRRGELVVCDRWEEDRWVECGGGIHFYLTREEAEAHAA